MKRFSKMWIDGTESVKKDSLEKHIKGEPINQRVISN